MSTETNPYASPGTASGILETERPRAWWRIVSGILFSLAGIPIVLYGLVICWLVIQADFSTPPVSPGVIMGCGILITGLGVSLNLVGIGIWRSNSGQWSTGLLGAAFCVLTYIVLIMMMA